MKYLLLFIVLLYTACTPHDGVTAVEEIQTKQMTGYSAVVGNVPFEKPAIIANNTIYIYTTTSQIRTELLNNQGSYFNVLYIDLPDSLYVKCIKILEIQQLKK